MSKTVVFRIGCVLIAIWMSVSCAEDEAAPAETVSNPFLKAEEAPPMVVAHRGGRDIAPENTLVAFDASVALGVDVLEMDVLITADSVLVLNHDVTIDRTSDGTGGVYQHTYEELLAFNFGYHYRANDGTFPYRDDPVRIATVEEVFQRYPGQRMIIEIKNTGTTGHRAARQLYSLIDRYGMRDDACVFSFDQTVMAHIYHQTGEDYYTGASIVETLEYFIDASTPEDGMRQYPFEVFALPVDLEGIDLPTGEMVFIEAAHLQHKAVHYWTINDEEKMLELIAAGADGIITDRPDVLLELIR